MNKIKNWVSTHKPATIGIVCAVIIAIIAAIALWFTTPPTEPEDTPNIAQVEGTGKINFDVKANDGWTKDSTPAIAHITGSKDDKSKDNDTVDFYHAINATEDNHGTSTVTVPAGDYKIEFVSPVNTDGSAYEIYDTGKATEVTVIGIKEPEKAPEAKTEDKSAQPAPDAEGSAVKDAKKDSTDNKLDDKCYINETPVHQEIKKIPAEQVTDEMLKDIVNKVNTAIANGDDTLKGDKGKEIVKKLEEGVKANPNASVETKGEAEETTKTEAVNEPAKTAETTENSSPVTKPAETQKPAQNKPEAPAPAPQPAPAPEPAPKPKEPIYENVWVSNWVTEQVWIGEQYVFAHDNYITMDLNDATSHQKTLVKQGFPGNYFVIDVYETKQVDKGHWEKRIVGYK